MRYAILLLLLGRLLPAGAQGACPPPTLVQKYTDDGYAVADEHGTLVIPFAERPLVVLSSNLVKVSLQYGGRKWGVLDRQNRLVVPIKYPEFDLDAVGCGYVLGRLDGATSLFDPAGRLVYHRPGRYTFRVYAPWQRLFEGTTGPLYQSSIGPDTLRMLDLATHRVLYAQPGAYGAQALYFGNSYKATGASHLLPFFAIASKKPERGSVRPLVRLINRQGRVLYDSLDGEPSIDSRGAVFMNRVRRSVIVADMRLRPIPFLSYRYDWVRRTGPGDRWWTVVRQGVSGLLSGTGKVQVPVHPGSSATPATTCFC